MYVYMCAYLCIPMCVYVQFVMSILKSKFCTSEINTKK